MSLRPFLALTTPCNGSQTHSTALQKQYNTERVRTRVLELWRETKYSIAQIAAHKDVAKAKSTV